MRRPLLALALATACADPTPAPAAVDELPIDVTPGPALQVRAGDTLVYLLSGTSPDLRPAIVLVGAGSDPSGDAIAQALRLVGAEPADVRAVLLPCAHRDTTAAAALFAGADVWTSPADHEALRGDHFAGGAWHRLRAHLGPPPPVPRRVREALPGHRLELAGLVFEVVALPGHTAGALAFRLGPVLFSGDALLASAAGAAPAPWYASDDHGLSLASLERLRRVQFTALADARTGYHADGRRRFERSAPK